MIVKRLVGAIVIFVTLFFAGGMVEKPEVFINIPSISIVFGCIIGGVLFSGRYKTNLISINWKNSDSNDLTYAAATYQYMGTLGVAGGVVVH